DLRALGHNSAQYIHVVMETAKLALADRERYYGDPEFAEVPLAGLLSKAYAAAPRGGVGPTAPSDQPAPGGPDAVPGGGGGGRPGACPRPGLGRRDDGDPGGRRGRQHVLGHPERGMVPKLPHHSRARLLPWDTGADVLAERSQPPRGPPAAQTSPHDALAVA